MCVLVSLRFPCRMVVMGHSSIARDNGVENYAVLGLVGFD